MAVRGSEFEREMQQLEAEIKKLEAEYNMFFAGRLPRLPWETRAQVEAMVKRYDRTPMRNTAERFRFGSLQARFASFCELWEKLSKRRKRAGPRLVVRARTHPRRRLRRRKRTASKSSTKRNSRSDRRNRSSQRALPSTCGRARKNRGSADSLIIASPKWCARRSPNSVAAAAEVKFRVVTKEGKVTLKVKADAGEKGGE